MWRLRRRLRGLRFDVTIDVQSLTKSAMLAWLSGAQRRIGFGNPGGRELSKWLNNERVDPKATHVVDRYLELLRPLGIESPAVRFQVPEHEEDREAAEEIIRQAAVGRRICDRQSGRGLAVEALAGRALRRRGAPTGRARGGCRRWWFGRAEPSSNLAEADCRRRPGRRPRPRRRRTLPQLAALARRARLFIGADTGPLHLAAAVGTPCVGLYGPWPAARHGPYGPQHIALQQMFFEGPARARRTAPAIYMESITTEMVCAGVRPDFAARWLNRRERNAVENSRGLTAPGGQSSILRHVPGAVSPRLLYDLLANPALSS